MKKQILLLATIITVAFISCSKEKSQTQQPHNFEEVATKKPGGGGGNPSVNLTKGL